MQENFVQINLAKKLSNNCKWAKITARKVCNESFAMENMCNAQLCANGRITQGTHIASDLCLTYMRAVLLCN